MISMFDKFIKKEYRLRFILVLILLSDLANEIVGVLS